jgi:hypothetical protein
VSGGGWTAVRMDSVTTVSYPEERYCVDLNDNLYEAGDTIRYYLSARNTIGVTTYWTQATGTVTSEAVARANAMEMTCLPANALTGADILVVDTSADGVAASFLEHDFQQLGVAYDRYDLQLNNRDIDHGLASRVKDVTQQLIPYYKKIIWTSGDKVEFTIGDGEAPIRRSDDFELLYAFLDQHTDDCGVYFTGDNLASEVTTLDGYWAGEFRSIFMNYTLVGGNHQSLGQPASPLVIAEPASYFQNPAGPDSLVAFGACPTFREFDVLAPVVNSSLEMTYSGDPARGALLSAEATNSNAVFARVVMSGFGYGAIRDDRAQVPYDRIAHLHTILQWLGNVIDAPTAAQSPTFDNSLSQNYPNPFNPATTIRYSTRARSRVTIRIYNVAGQLVRTLVDRVHNPGPRAVEWDGRSDAGRAVSSGVYFYRLNAGDFTETRKMVVLK